MKGTTAEVDKLTKAKYGAATVTAATSAEAAVKFVTLPTAKGGDKKITVSGSTDVGGFVYCALSKAGTRRVRMLANTTNSTAANTTNSTAAKTTTTAAVTSMTAASTKEKYTIKRTTTKVKALNFSFEFTGLGEGKTHDFLCEATSLNPTNP